MKYEIEWVWDVAIWHVEADSKEEAQALVQDYYDNGVEPDSAKANYYDGYGPAIIKYKKIEK